MSKAKKEEVALKTLREEDVAFVASSRDVSLFHLRKSKNSEGYTAEDLTADQTAFPAETQWIMLELAEDDFLGCVYYKRNSKDAVHNHVLSVNYLELGSGSEGGASITDEALAKRVTSLVADAMPKPVELSKEEQAEAAQAERQAFADNLKVGLIDLGLLDKQGQLIKAG